MKIRITSLPKYQTAGSVRNDDDDWIRKIMEYEASKGSATGTGLSNWGYNNWKKFGHKAAPSTIDEAIQYYKQDYLPQVSQYPTGLRERAGDFLYNTGRDPRVYMLDQYLRSIGQSGLPNRSSYNVDIKTPGWTPELQRSLDEQWNLYKDKIENLPLDQRANLLDQGRDFYYQNINQVNGKPNPAYDATWKGRIGMFGKYSMPSNEKTENSLKRTSFPLPEKIYANQFKSTKELPVVGNSASKVPPVSFVGSNTNNVPPVSSNIIYKSPTDLNDPAMNLPDYVKDEENSEDLSWMPTLSVDQKDIQKEGQGYSGKNIWKNFQPSFKNNLVTKAALPIAQFFNDKSKQKDYNKWFNEQKFNSQAVMPSGMSGKHGNYSVTGSSYGKFRYPEMGFTNEGRYFGNPGLQAFQRGGGILSGDIFLPLDLIQNNSSDVTIVDTKENKITEKPINTKIPSHWEHYNPGNIHIGDFAESYGASTGRPDTGGRVAIFPNMETGLKAMKDLLFGSKYKDLTVEQARNKWVTGKPNVKSESSINIVKAVGTNKKLSDLTKDEKNKLIAEFIKWEDREVYNKLANENMLFNEGGSINNTNMKIRITKLPENEMKYGGQSGYGFDLGQRNTYSDMPDNPYENSSTTLQPVSREDANVEAEKGETVFGDLDNDGHKEHMTIGGKRHSEGGTPLNLPEGSFIYSDTKKMKIKDPNVLKFFGKGGSTKGVTPAEIAKSYNINKYKAILQDPNADGLKKNTANLMIKNYENKLAHLAYIQESMKGFPQGVPEVVEEVFNEEQPEKMYGGESYSFGGSYIPNYQMAYGGDIPYADGGLEMVEDPKKKKYKLKDKEIEAIKVAKVPIGYKPYEGVPGLYWKQTPGIPGRPAPKRKPVITPAWLKASPEKRKQMSKNQDEEWEKRHKSTNPISGSEDYVYIEENIPEVTVNPPEVATPPQFSLDKDYTDDTPIVSRSVSNGRKPFFGNQFAVGPKRYHAYAAPLQQYIPDPTFLDPSLALANNAAIATTMSRGYTGRPSQYAAMANAAQMNAITNAANILGTINNQNVGIANQFAPAQVDILNKANQYEANRRDTLAYNENMYDKEYRNSLRQYLNNLDKYRKGDYEYYTKRNMLNATNPYYSVVDNPNPWRGGNIVFKPGVSAYNTIIGPSASSSSSYEQYQKDIDDLKATGKYTERQIEKILDRKYGTVNKPSSNPDLRYWNQSYFNASQSSLDDDQD